MRIVFASLRSNSAGSLTPYDTAQIRVQSANRIAVSADHSSTFWPAIRRWPSLPLESVQVLPVFDCRVPPRREYLHDGNAR
jgi:hypothetical protein